MRSRYLLLAMAGTSSAPLATALCRSSMNIRSAVTCSVSLTCAPQAALGPRPETVALPRSDRSTVSAVPAVGPPRVLRVLRDVAGYACARPSDPLPVARPSRRGRLRRRNGKEPQPPRPGETYARPDDRSLPSSSVTPSGRGCSKGDRHLGLQLPENRIRTPKCRVCPGRVPQGTFGTFGTRCSMRVRERLT